MENGQRKHGLYSKWTLYQKKGYVYIMTLQNHKEPDPHDLLTHKQYVWVKCHQDTVRNLLKMDADLCTTGGSL